MRAVNLIPADKRRGSVTRVAAPTGPGTFVLLGLTVAVVLLAVYVFTGNTISSREAKLASDRAQLANDQALANRLESYEKFAALAQARAQTIREILAGSFDWHAALSDLSKVVPANTDLQSLNASVSPSDNAGSGGSSLRSAINAPAFDITGCTGSQDDVARLMSRLRAMNDVTRVTLESSTAGSAAASTGSSAVSSAPGSCGIGPAFHLLVFFAPLSGSAGASATTLPTSTTSTTTTATTASTSSSTTGAAG